MEELQPQESKHAETPFAWNFELQEKLKNTIYCGIFIDPESLYEAAPPSLAKAIKDPHITVKYAPAENEVHGDLIGKEVEIQAIGYGKDDNNEGLLVELKTDDKKLSQLCEQIPRPHITLSVSEKGKPVNTAKLNFSPLENPFTIQGKYGAFVAQKSPGQNAQPPEIITSQS